MLRCSSLRSGPTANGPCSAATRTAFAVSLHKVGLTVARMARSRLCNEGKGTAGLGMPSTVIMTRCWATVSAACSAIPSQSLSTAKTPHASTMDGGTSLPAAACNAPAPKAASPSRLAPISSPNSTCCSSAPREAADWLPRQACRPVQHHRAMLLSRDASPVGDWVEEPTTAEALRARSTPTEPCARSGCAPPALEVPNPIPDPRVEAPTVEGNGGEGVACCAPSI